MHGLVIRSAEPHDHDAIWAIFHDVVARGDTYAYAPDTTRDEALHAWFPRDGHTFVGALNGEVVASYVIKPNQPGLGNHVVNGSYLVATRASGQGIGAALCEHSLKMARELGFLAMQFNIVVATNVRAIELWKRFGFTIIGTVPKAFRHATLGAVDVHVMHRML
jgi:L-amino acid N-acyltransferase YncA